MTNNRTFYISKKKVHLAGEFIMEHGRDIEKMLYQFCFGKEKAANVINTLETYCNEDGGVGRLELNSLYEGSMPINCSRFFSIIHGLKMQAEFIAVENALQYLKNSMNNYDSWYASVPAINCKPRAVWWNWEDDKMQGYSFNPTCEIIGYFYHFGGGDYRVFAKEMLDILYEEMLLRPTLKMHDVINLMQLCRILPDIIAERFIKKLNSYIKVMLVMDANKWSESVLSPLSIFKSPLDPLYHEYEKEIILNLNYEITMQSDDGIWMPNMHWQQFDEEYKMREKQIISSITLNKLVQFKNFNRITRMG